MEVRLLRLHHEDTSYVPIASKATALNTRKQRADPGELGHFVMRSWRSSGVPKAGSTLVSTLAWPRLTTDYAEDTECTICHSALFNQRYRCELRVKPRLTQGVSCPKFDLCRSCYQKIDEIHPAHIFLSLPDKPIPQLSVAPPTEHVEVPAPPARHPGAFCHKFVFTASCADRSCLQDIVGPRFHCAVCPSWDLCIQCEGLNATGNGSHTADHIMMKV